MRPARRSDAATSARAHGRSCAASRRRAARVHARRPPPALWLESVRPWRHGPGSCPSSSPYLPFGDRRHDAVLAGLLVREFAELAAIFHDDDAVAPLDDLLQLRRD